MLITPTDNCHIADTKRDINLWDHRTKIEKDEKAATRKHKKHIQIKGISDEIIHLLLLVIPPNPNLIINDHNQRGWDGNSRTSNFEARSRKWNTVATCLFVYLCFVVQLP